MNRMLLSTSLALALSASLAFAQQQDTTPAPRAKHHHTHNPQREAAKISKKLNLSSDQSAKLEPILADRDNKIDSLKRRHHDLPRCHETAVARHSPADPPAARHGPHTGSTPTAEGPPSPPRRAIPDPATDQPASRHLTFRRQPGHPLRASLSVLAADLFGQRNRLDLIIQIRICRLALLL